MTAAEATNIAKANSYDIVSKQVVELKEIIRQLIEVGELDSITFTDPDDTYKFSNLVFKAKILSL